MLPKIGVPITLLGPFPEGLLWLHWMKGHEELGRPFEYELEIYSESSELPFESLLGQPLTVCLGKDDGKRFFNGIVTRLARTGEKEGYMVFRALLAPRLWLLTRTRDCRVYQNLTVPDVVKAVLREHAITFSERLQTDSYRTWDYLTQYRESDFDFVSRIMEQEGIYYYFKHGIDKHELVLADSLSSHDPVPGYERIPVHPPGAHQVVRDHLTDWRPIHQATSGKVTLQNHDFRLRRGSDIRAARAAEPAHEGDELEIYDYPGPYLLAQNQQDAEAGATRQAGEHYALARLEEQRSRLQRVEAEGNVRGVEVGALIQIEALPAVQHRFLVTATDHHLRNIDFRSSEAPAEHEICHVILEGIDSQRPFRPAPTTAKPVIAGPQTATVVGKAGEELWTDRYGRVKVQFHWDREAAGDETTSCWVRVGQIWAGSGWGAIAIPRIGHEVIVQFLEGDPDRPLVTGSVYNSDNMPPYALPANATQTGIKSRSSKGGGSDNFNEIRFEDKKGEEELHIQAEKDLTALVKHDQSTAVGNDQSTTVGNDQSTTVQANRTLGVTGNESHSVGGTRSLSVTGQDTQSFAADRTISVAATDTHIIEGVRTESFNAGRNSDVKSFDNTTVSGGDKSTTVHGGYNISADQQFQVQQGGNQLFIKDQVLVDTVGKVLVSNPACQMSFEGGKAMISAASELTFVCGSASITLRSDGTISIDAPQNVTATSGKSGIELMPASATVSAAKTTVAGKGMTEIMGAVVKIN